MCRLQPGPARLCQLAVDQSNLREAIKQARRRTTVSIDNTSNSFFDRLVAEVADRILQTSRPPQRGQLPACQTRRSPITLRDRIASPSTCTTLLDRPSTSTLSLRDRITPSSASSYPTSLADRISTSFPLAFPTLLPKQGPESPQRPQSRFPKPVSLAGRSQVADRLELEVFRSQVAVSCCRLARCPRCRQPPDLACRTRSSICRNRPSGS